MTNNTKKITKRDQFATILNIIDAVKDTYELDSDISFEDIINFINHEIELLDNKTAAAQKRAAAKKEEGDLLREKIYNVLTDNFLTIDEIVSNLNDPDVTRNMVTSRLTALCRQDSAVKDMITVNGRKISAYKKA